MKQINKFDDEKNKKTQKENQKIKIIKDTIHGYIELEKEYCNIIDSPQFQRLKWIEQTSFRVLYPSARHDRFVHSIGTFHLGKLAFNSFFNNVKILFYNKDLEKEINENKLKISFLSACLLHDVGHSPFSHTCEDLFNYKEQMKNISSCLNSELLKSIDKINEIDEINTLDKKKFISDYKKILRNETPLEHEVVSSIIILNNVNTFFTENKNDIDFDLIIRSILGCVYGLTRESNEKNRINYGIKNCLIRLLNSKTIDVDKLDYITRDAKMSGFENTPIDTPRLLNSLTFIKEKNIYFPAFNKTALSVLDNVIKAKKSQNKWIVSHPSVQYESSLIRKCIGIALNKYYEKHQAQLNSNGILSIDDLIKKLFNYNALSIEGIDIAGFNYKLLSDVDILFFLKNFYNESIIQEFFCRNQRYKPIWKSYEEYKFLFNNHDKEIADYFLPLINHISGVEELSKTNYINEDFYEVIENSNSEELLSILDNLKNFSKDNKYEFNYLLLPIKNLFNIQIDYNSTYIRFDSNENDYVNYNLIHCDITNKKQLDYTFFYLYSKNKINKKKFVNFFIDKIPITV